MRRDCLGLDYACDADETAAAIDDFILGVLRYETRAVRILPAAEKDGDCALAHAYVAMLYMFLEAPEAPARAGPALTRAEARAPHADARTQSVIAILRAWADGAMGAAFARLEAHVRAYPRDLLMVKLQQYLLFNLGDAAAMTRAALSVLDVNRDLAPMHALLAFAYEESHLLGKGEEAARAALAIEPSDPWAQHAIAHVQITQGRIDEGARFLEGVCGGWGDLNSFMRTHNWWHLALFYLSQGRYADALKFYDDQVWGVDKAYSQDQVGAISLLTRLELAGVDVGARWADLAPFLQARAHDAVLPFLSVQYLYGLARLEDPAADVLLRAIETTSAREKARGWRTALTLSRGLVAHARGDFGAAADAIGAARSSLPSIGGSHAQRDLFDLLWIDALIGDRQLTAAQQALELRRAFDPHGAPLHAQLARVYDDLGLVELAAETRKLGCA